MACYTHHGNCSWLGLQCDFLGNSHIARMLQKAIKCMSDCKIEHLWVGNNWLRSYLVLSDHRHLDDSDSVILWINRLNDRWVPEASIVKLRTINHNAEYQLFAGSHESMSAHELHVSYRMSRQLAGWNHAYWTVQLAILPVSQVSLDRIWIS